MTKWNNQTLDRKKALLQIILKEVKDISGLKEGTKRNSNKFDNPYKNRLDNLAEFGYRDPRSQTRSIPEVSKDNFTVTRSLRREREYSCLAVSFEQQSYRKLTTIVEYSSKRKLR